MGSVQTSAAARWLAEEEEQEDAWIKALKISAIVVLATLSAIFSGLNLGLMCLDANQLELLIKAADREEVDKQAKQQAAWAKRILPLRRDGNTLLCTVLLGNVMVNSYMAILLEEMWSGTMAVIMSTLVIVTFGEIIPQSLCYKHGLRIGSALVPLLRLFWCVLLPFSKPLAFILDRIFGEEMGQVLDKHQLLTLIDYQRKQAPHLLTEQEANILHGSIDFSAMTAQSVMVPLGECFCLDAGAIINQGLCAAVAAAGFSRIPVLDRDPKNPKGQFAVVGLIHVKDLLLIDAEQDLPLKAILPLIGREVFIVDDDRPLPDLLDEFRRGKSQLAVVRSVVVDDDCDPYYRHVGILTLQDLLNTIVQEDVHEVDAGEEDATSQVSSVPSNLFMNVPRFQEKLPRGRSHASRWQAARPLRGLSRDEALAAAVFLQRRHPTLFEAVATETLEGFLLRDCRMVRGPPEGGHDGSRALYRRGRACTYATLIITGEVKVFAGRDGFESIHGPWSLLGKRCLELCRQSVASGASTAQPAFTPDFTAYTAEEKDGPRDGTRLLLITVDAYNRLLSVMDSDAGKL